MDNMKEKKQRQFINEIERLTSELAREKEANRILRDHVNSIESYKSEYEKLIDEAKEEIRAVREMKLYFENLAADFEKELSDLK